MRKSVLWPLKLLPGCELDTTWFASAADVLVTWQGHGGGYPPTIFEHFEHLLKFQRNQAFWNET